MLARRCGWRKIPLRPTVHRYAAHGSPRWLPPASISTPPSRCFSITRQSYAVSTSNSSSNTSSTSYSSTPSKKPERSNVGSERHYSTTTDVSSTEYSNSEFPFYGSSQPSPPLPGSETASTKSLTNDGRTTDFSWLRLHDPGSFLQLQTPELPLHPRPIESSRSATDPFKVGTSGMREDVMSGFVACVNMKKMERASVMLDRLHRDFIDCVSVKSDKDTQERELLSSHNFFLRGYLNQALEASEQKISLVSSGDAVGKDGQKEEFSLRDYSLAKLEEWYWDYMVQKYEMNGNGATFAILLEAVILSSRSSGVKMQDIGKLIFKWEKMKLGVLGDVLRHLSDSVIAEIQLLYKITPKDLHRDQLHLLEGSQVPELAEVMSTEVKGFGLEAVKQSLRSFADHSVEKYQPEFNSPEEKAQFAIERQKILEQDAYDAAIHRWRADSEAMEAIGLKSHNPAINPLLHQWLTAMVPLIKQELKNVEEAEANPGKTANFERCQYGPYLRLLPPEKLAGITITNIIRLATGWHDATAMKASAAVISIGRAVESEYISEQLKKAFETKQGDEKFYEKRALQKQLNEARNDKDLAMLLYRQNRRAEMDKDGTAFIISDRWSQPVRAKVGSILASILFQCAKIKVMPTNPKAKQLGRDLEPIEQPALFHSYQFVGGKKIGVIKLHDDFSKKLMTEPLRGTTLAKQLPMVARPRPWCAWNDGAYYFTPSRMVRIKDSLEQAMYIKEASKQGNLDRLFAGLDVLGSTAWKINQKVFDIVLQVWNSGEKFADIPPASDRDVTLPEPPLPDADLATKAAFKETYQEAALARRNHHSQRCDVNFKMEIARAFYNEEFYFPHNVDFRGRAYAMPPHLNHIGNDLCRGLLKFSEKKPLGESGLRWLKIHLANLCGFDKASLKAREEYTEGHLEEIFDSAKDPLGGNRWWLKSEDPWQCLATCMELAEALSLPDPTKFESNLPVHQDGTCNGLQHYAALGGDIIGAKQVNLEPSEKPQDVYTGVADLVNEVVAKEAEAGCAEAQELLGHINRKVVKQTVMTNVYGVTFIGAKAQVRNRLVEKGVFPKDRVNKLALYLTRKIFDSLQSMFTGAHEIQKWFGECARRISRSVGPSQWEKFHIHYDESIPVTSRQAHTKERGKAEFMTSVVWTTPLGLPVVQPYRHEATVAVKTNLQQITIVDTSIINQVDSRRQMAAFPPNFVHSLDATHMLLSALASKQAGLTFAAVHDSFWTHACHVDTMSRVLRDAFVNLHSEDIVKKLREEFVVRYRGHKTLVSIPENHKVAKEIVNHRRELSAKIAAQKAAEKGKPVKLTKKGVPAKPRRTKMSITAVDDLMRELERERLLNSENEEDRKKGEEMVTAASIYKNAGLTPDHDFEKVASSAFGEGFDISSAAPPVELQGPTLEGEIVEAKVEEETEGTPSDQTKKKTPSKRVYVWVDLEFPEVPKKGDFDVSRLKDSQYFFS
ncbi:hypothetical protein ABW19_dt0200289 [Dactylella cylindrospora]|nr:hypothetical protein ABW19_dt0200289 [Dactylella cylindrospora]